MLVVGSAGNLHVTLYPQWAGQGRGSPTPLVRAAMLPEFGATQEVAFLIPGAGLQAGQVFYARMQAADAGADPVYFSAAPLRGCSRGDRGRSS